MRLELRSLIWKEWRERRGVFLLCTTWMLLGVVYAVGYERGHRMHAPVGGFNTTCMLYGLFAAVFLAMRTALGEVTQGTLGYSAALPVSLRQIAWVRLGGAIVTLVGPIVLGALVLSLFLATGFVEQGPTWSFDGVKFVLLPQRPPLSALESLELLWTITAITSASNVQILLLLSLIGARRRAETQIGFIGAGVAFVWLMLRFPFHWMNNNFLLNMSGMLLPQTLAMAASYKDVGGSYDDIMMAPRVWLPLAGNLLVLTALAVGFGSLYGSRPRARVVAGPKWPGWRMPALLPWTPGRLPGPWASLVWLNVRQAVPLCLPGLFLATLVVAFMQLVHQQRFHPAVVFKIAHELPGGILIVGLLWGAVVGSGVFASECDFRLEQFWRSRPISPSAWFWVKYCGGLAAVLGVLDFVAVVIDYDSLLHFRRNHDGMSWAYLACVPLLHTMTYSLAVLGTCWLRRPILAGMAALFSFFLIFLALESIPGGEAASPFGVFSKLVEDGAVDLTRHGYPAVYGGIAAFIVLTSLAAWLGALRPASFRRPVLG